MKIAWWNRNSESPVVSRDPVADVRAGLIPLSAFHSDEGYRDVVRTAAEESFLLDLRELLPGWSVTMVETVFYPIRLYSGSVPRRAPGMRLSALVGRRGVGVRANQEWECRSKDVREYTVGVESGAPQWRRDEIRAATMIERMGGGSVEGRFAATSEQLKHAIEDAWRWAWPPGVTLVHYWMYHPTVEPLWGLSVEPDSNGYLSLTHRHFSQLGKWRLPPDVLIERREARDWCELPEWARSGELRAAVGERLGLPRQLGDVGNVWQNRGGASDG